MQKWLLGINEKPLADWTAGDLNQDGVLDIFDLALMKHALFSK